MKQIREGCKYSDTCVGCKYLYADNDYDDSVIGCAAPKSLTKNNTIMSKLSGIEWGKKAYIVLSLAVVVVIWAVFFVSLFFGRLSHGPIEETWFGEIMKWAVMSVFLVGIVDVTFYALIATIASRKAEGLDEKKDKK